jgi:hypothetical protein
MIVKIVSSVTLASQVFVDTFAARGAMCMTGMGSK